MKYIFLDTETTGFRTEDRLCQIAYKMDETTHSSLYKPPVPISPGASEVTGINDDTVKDKPAFLESEAHLFLKGLFDNEETVVVAHNARFDIGMLAKEGLTPKNVVCTMRMSRMLNLPSDNMKLQTLRDYFNIQVEAQAHDALGDVIVLEKVFYKLRELYAQKFVETVDIDKQIVDMMKGPIIHKKMPFGKHKGVDLYNVPKDYLYWLRSQTDIDQDILYSIKNLIK